MTQLFMASRQKQTIEIESNFPDGVVYMTKSHIFLVILLLVTITIKRP